MATYGFGSNAMDSFNLAMNNNSSMNYGLGSNAGFSFDTSGIMNQQTGTNPMGAFNTLFGGTDAQGNFSTGALAPTIGAVGTLANSWLGFQQLGIARDQLGLQQEAWNLQREEFEYQRDRRTAEEAAYAEVRNNQQKNRL